MTTRKRRILTLVIIVFIGVLCFAQKGGPTPPPPPTGGPSPPGLTIGVDTLFLVVLALCLGVRKLLSQSSSISK